MLYLVYVASTGVLYYCTVQLYTTGCLILVLSGVTWMAYLTGTRVLYCTSVVYRCTELILSPSCSHTRGTLYTVQV